MEALSSLGSGWVTMAREKGPGMYKWGLPSRSEPEVQELLLSLRSIHSTKDAHMLPNQHEGTTAQAVPIQRKAPKVYQEQPSAVDAGRMEPATPQRSLSQKKHKMTKQRPENVFPHHHEKVVSPCPTTTCSVRGKMVWFLRTGEEFEKNTISVRPGYLTKMSRLGIS